MRKYELMYILDPTLDEEQMAALSAKIEEAIAKQGASLVSAEPWNGGRRRLAYRIKGHREGYYVIAIIDANPEAVSEIERRLRVIDGILRFLTVRVDERQEKAERRRAVRESKEGARKQRRAAKTRDTEASSKSDPPQAISSDEAISEEAENQ